LTTTPKRFLRKKDVAARYACSDRQVDRMSEDGRLPGPIYLQGSKFPLWAEHELDETDRQAVRQRDASAA
jgi:predicted DNA-binding transcriptional regulator AlpA